VDQSVVDRRQAPRFRDLPAARATLRPGCPVVLVDLSTTGALVQGERPLRPGGRVHLQVVTPRQTCSLAAVVVRCAVWAVDPDRGVIYRGALKFDQRCDLCT
jgi:hypothetical protein